MLQKYVNANAVVLQIRKLQFECGSNRSPVYEEGHPWAAALSSSLCEDENGLWMDVLRVCRGSFHIVHSQRDVCP